tara:strand:- start:483 stop:869 length:387 start_codon:yes stop_codon:yes gene_type:complete
MAGIDNYWNTMFITDMARTSTQGAQFSTTNPPEAIVYVNKWGWPDNQSPKLNEFNQTTYTFGNYPAEFHNAAMPSSYISTVPLEDTKPSRIFFWQIMFDGGSNKRGSVGFIFPSRATLAFDVINNKYI